MILSIIGEKLAFGIARQVAFRVVVVSLGDRKTVRRGVDLRVVNAVVRDQGRRVGRIEPSVPETVVQESLIPLNRAVGGFRGRGQAIQIVVRVILNKLVRDSWNSYFLLTKASVVVRRAVVVLKFQKACITRRCSQ